jgi:hypothetical protein
MFGHSLDASLFICTKMLPICICGTLTPKRFVHIFAFDSERIYIKLASAAAAAAATAPASIFQINKGTLPPPPPPLPPRPPPPPQPPPPLLSSCLVPFAHRYCCRRHFHCFLLIVVCPCLCHCRRLCHLWPLPPLPALTITAVPLPTVVVMIVFVVTAAAVVFVIEVIIPVAVVNNDAMPGPRRSLRRRLLPSLLSRCFL